MHLDDAAVVRERIEPDMGRAVAAHRHQPTHLCPRTNRRSPRARCSSRSGSRADTSSSLPRVRADDGRASHEQERNHGLRGSGNPWLRGYPGVRSNVGTLGDVVELLLVDGEDHHLRARKRPGSRTPTLSSTAPGGPEVWSASGCRSRGRTRASPASRGPALERLGRALGVREAARACPSRRSDGRPRCTGTRGGDAGAEERVARRLVADGAAVHPPRISMSSPP